MALKNYTSNVSVDRSIAFIERKLVVNGARDIMKQYNPDQRVESILFMIPIDGVEMVFKLPARLKACERVLEGMLSQRSKPATRKKIPAQAARTAWKILSDWVEAQMAMIELAQVDVMEVFLPYAYNPATQQTYFEAMKERGYKGLLE
jgi:hypothetical protein